MLLFRRPVGSDRTARVRVARGVAAGAAVVGVALVAWLGTTRAAPAALASATLRALASFPADSRCGHPTGQLAALAQGQELPEAPCLADLGQAPLAAPLLLALVRDGARPVAVRSSALSALLLGGEPPEGLLESLIVAPKPPPALRSRAWELAAGGPRGMDWVDRGEDVAVHGLYDRAAARRFAEGEPASATAAARALAASPPGAPEPGVLRDVYAGLGTTPARLAEGARRSASGQMPLGFPPEWTNPLRRHRCDGDCVPLLLALLEVEADRGGEEPGPSAAAVPGADAAIDALYPDGERADHVREELAAAAAWIGRTAEPWRAARLVSAVLHPDARAQDAAAALNEAGDPHAVLVRGGGNPGATALAATDLALATRVPITTWATDTGVGVQVAGQLFRVDACAAPRPAAATEASWRAVPTGGVDALALVEGAARALREREVATARAQVEAARATWADAPGLAAVDAAVIAAEAGATPYGPPAAGSALPAAGSAPPAASSAPSGSGVGGPPPGAGSPPAAAPGPTAGLVGIPGPSTLFVSRPPFPAPRQGRRGAPAPPPDLRAAARATLLARLDRIRALTPDPEDRVRAGWWAADGGDPELARRLLVPLPGERGPASALGATLRAAVAQAVGEPTAPAPAPATAGAALPSAPPPAAAASAAAASSAGAPAAPPPAAPALGEAPAAPPPCPAPYRADPPLAAWAGAPPSGD